MKSGRIWLGSYVAFSLLFVQPCLGGEFTYLPDHPGKVAVIVERTSPSTFNLSAKEVAVFKANLERLRGLLLTQPVFNPPRGVKFAGFIRADGIYKAAKSAPVPGQGRIYSHFAFLDKKSGKPGYFGFPTDEIQIHINEPGEGFESAGRDDRWRFYYEPRQTGELSGFPIFRDNRSGDEIIVLHRGGHPLWVPVSWEEYLKMWMSMWEEQAAKNRADTVSPRIVERYKAVLAGMSAEKRQQQAHNIAGNDMLERPLDSEEALRARPIVKPNPKLFDPSFPRSAFQLITLRFNYTGNLNHDNPGPTEYGDISPYRVWEALHRSDWSAIGAALTSK